MRDGAWALDARAAAQQVVTRLNMHESVRLPRTATWTRGPAYLGQSTGHRSMSTDSSGLRITLPRPPLRWLLGLLLLLVAPALHAAPDNAATSSAASARALVERAIELTRSRGSIAEMTMEVHRPEWQRSSSLKAWTRGRDDALIRFTAPAKDAGNATLKLGRDMWTFAPRVNRVIRLPASLMSQSWAGSDFSYNDLARSDELLVHYDLRVGAQQKVDGAEVFVIEATPRATAPVVWGRQQLRIRADGVVLETTYFDQELRPVKRMQTLRIGTLGGRIVPIRSAPTAPPSPRAIMASNSW